MSTENTLVQGGLMQVLHGEFNGALCVTESLALHGTLRRTATVTRGAHFTLGGVSRGDVIIEKDGDAALWGVIKGSVRNRGGRVSIFGVVDGDVETTDGVTWIAPTSLVRGKTQL
jgi:hypothetical protein